MKYFKGDTLNFNYYLEVNKEKVPFNESKIYVVIYDKINNLLFKEKTFNTTKNQTDIEIIFTCDEMKNISAKDYVIEIKILDEHIKTTYQECLHVVESWCLNERS